MLNRFGNALAVGALMLAALLAALTLQSLQTIPQENQKYEQSAEESPEQKPEYVPTAEERIADYTFWLTILTGLLVVVAAAQIFLILRAESVSQASADAAVKSADAAIAGNRLNRDVFIASERPWIKSSVEIAGDLVFGDRGMSLAITPVLENVGKTPANAVVAKAALTFAAEGIAPYWVKRKEISENLKTRNAALDEFVGHTIFPGQTARLQTIRLRISAAELTTANADQHQQLVGLLPYVTLVVDYLFAIGEGGHHQTINDWHLFQMAPDGLAAAMKSDGGNVPKSTLRLLDAQGSYAD